MEFGSDWIATYDRMPGKPATLRVQGTCRFPTSGWTWSLSPRAPQGINSRMLMLTLTVNAPAVRSDVVTEQHVEYAVETDNEYDQVHILVVGASAEALLLDVSVVD